MSPWRRGFDIREYLDAVAAQTVSLLDGTAAGVLLIGEDGKVVNSGATSDVAQELTDVQMVQGRGLIPLALETGMVQEVPDLGATEDRWGVYASMCVETGNLSGISVPMVDDDHQVIGALTVGMPTVGALTPKQVAFVGTMGRMSSAMLSQHERHADARETVSQLQRALDRRVIVEQAKGKVSHAMGLTPREAFELIRKHARGRRLSLSDVAEEIMDTEDGHEVLRRYL